MYQLCEFIIENVEENCLLCYSTLSLNDFDVLDKTINIISQSLDIDKTEINVNLDNLNCHNETVISLKYKNRICEFYERFDTQRDYICVRMLPI